MEGLRPLKSSPVEHPLQTFLPATAKQVSGGRGAGESDGHDWDGEQTPGCKEEEEDCRYHHKIGGPPRNGKWMSHCLGAN